LSDIYISDSKQKADLLKRKEDAQRALQKNLSDAETPRCVETFNVSREFMVKLIFKAI
jgi:hypothetical protein